MSFNSQSHTTRTAYWQFAPVALVVPVIFASQNDLHTWRGIASVAVTAMTGPIGVIVGFAPLLLLVPIHIAALIFTLMVIPTVLGQSLVTSVRTAENEHMKQEAPVYRRGM